MKQLLVAAFLLVASAAHAADADRLFDMSLEICRQMANLDPVKGKRCVEDLIRQKKSELKQVNRLQGVREVGKAFVEKYGVVEPDSVAKLTVAVRKRILFAVILDACWRSVNATSDAEQMEVCLDQREKAEKMLGNDLMSPAPEGWPSAAR